MFICQRGGRRNRRQSPWTRCLSKAREPSLPSSTVPSLIWVYHPNSSELLLYQCMGQHTIYSIQRYPELFLDDQTASQVKYSGCRSHFFEHEIATISQMPLRFKRPYLAIRSRLRLGQGIAHWMKTAMRNGLTYQLIKLVIKWHVHSQRGCMFSLFSSAVPDILSRGALMKSAAAFQWYDLVLKAEHAYWFC